MYVAYLCRIKELDSIEVVKLSAVKLLAKITPLFRERINDDRKAKDPGRCLCFGTTC